MASKREALISSAEKSLQKGKVDAALRDYLKVLEETPADINILNKVGDLQVRLGKNDESIPFFLRIAEHYARDGFYVRAIAMYKKINKLDPARLDIYEKLAELYVKQQLWMEAKSNYQVLADYLLKQDNLAGAIGIYQKMAAIEPQNLQLHVKLADLFTQAKRIQEALKEYGVVAAALSERGANEEAIRVYEKALRLAPDNVDILRTLVALLVSINSVDQARAALRKGLEASPRSVPLFLLSAETALAANDIAEARSYSEKARAVEPDNEEVLSAAVRIQLKGRRPDLAWVAAAPLADAAVRRGEARKAIAILVPIARVAPEMDDLVKKIVDIAAGVGDEATALPYRAALADLYRKKGKLAEAADLLRLCTRVQPDNAEYRARLAQLEPQSVAPTIVPPRVAPTSIERHMEVTLSGFAGLPAPSEAPPEPAPPPPVPEAPPSVAGEEFEFDLDDSEMLEEAGAPLPEPTPAAAPTPPRGLAAPAPAAYPGGDDPGAEPVWNNLTAAEALEAFEAREAAARSGSPGLDEIEELRPEAELPQTPVSVPMAGGFPALDLDLAPPAGFGEGLALDEAALPSGAGWPAQFPEVAWPSADVTEAEAATLEELAGPVSFGPVSRPTSGDAALEDALVEADVFRRYGLLDKAVDQLRPLLEKEPGNVRVREKLFEIHLEQGHREEAREHAAFLAEGYGAEGREDRIRGLEALLGEPLRRAERPEPEPVEAIEEPPEGEVTAPEAPVEAIEEPPEEELLAPEGPVEEPEGEALGTLEDIVTAFQEAEGAGEVALPEPVPEGVQEPSPLEASPAVALPVDEPPTEIISAVLPPQVLEPEAPEEETSAPGPEAAIEEPAPVAEAPVPAEPPAAPEPPAEPVAAAPAVAEPRARAKVKLSAEEILGIGTPVVAPKKVRSVSPDDVALELLGRKGPKPKAKAAARPKDEPVLPDDLLRSLRKPGPARSPERPLAEAPSPEVPAVPPPASPEGKPGGMRLALGAETGGEPAEAPFEEAAAPPAVSAQPTHEELADLDFCLDQGMVVDAAERLQGLEGRFPGDPELAARRLRLEGGRGNADAPRAALHDILSDDLDSVLDASLGRALTEDMVRESPEAAPAVPAPPAGPVLDESGLFSDEQEFFNFADELHTELRKEGETAPTEEGREVSLEEIFRDFKKGVEQQLSPEDYETHYNLGIAYKEMGLTDEAIGEFQLAAKDPLHAVECCAMLGLCFLEKGLPQLAVKWYRKGLETIGIKDEDKLGLQYALAGVLEQIGDRDGAYRTYLEIFGANANYRDVPARIKELRPFVAS